jgi:hypothetical protein
MLFEALVLEYCVATTTINTKLIDSYTALYLDFEGTSGTSTFTDRSRYLRTPTVNGSAVLTNSVKKIGECSGNFNGTSQSVTFADAAEWAFGTGAFTVEFWFNANTVTGTANILHQGHSSTYYPFKIIRSGNEVLLYMSSNGTSWDIVTGGSFGLISLDAWYHVMVTRTSNGSIRGFMNGNLCFTIGGLSGVSVLDGTGALTIGGASSLYFGGRVDELIVSKGIARQTSNFTPLTVSVGETASSGSDAPWHIVQDGKIQASTTDTFTGSDYIEHGHKIVYEETASATDSIVGIKIDDPNLVLLIPFEGGNTGDTTFSTDYTQNDLRTFSLHITPASASTTTTYDKTVAKFGSSAASISGSVAQLAFGQQPVQTPTDGFYGMMSFPADSLNFGAGDFTVEGWLRCDFTTLTGVSTLFGIASMNEYTHSFAGAPHIPLSVYRSNAALYLGLSSNGSSFNMANPQITPNMVSGAWNHLSIVRNGTSLKSYWNGVQYASVTVTGALYFPSDEIFRLMFGAYRSTTGSGTKFYFQRFKFYKGRAVRTANFVPNTYAPNPESADASDAVAVSILLPSGGYGYFKEISESALLSENSVTLISSTETTRDIHQPCESSGSITDTIFIEKDETGLVVAFEFEGDHGSTTFTDRKGHTFAKVGTGIAEIRNTKPRIGKTSLYLGGSAGLYCTTGLSDMYLGSGEWAVDMWIYPTDLSANRYLCRLNYTTNDPLIVQVTTTGQLYVTSQRSGPSYVVNYNAGLANTIVPNKWQRITISKLISGANYSFRVYVNGQPVIYTGTTFFYQDFTSTTHSYDNLTAVALGCANSSAGSGFVGYIDQIKIWKGYTPFRQTYGVQVKKGFQTLTPSVDDLNSSSSSDLNVGSEWTREALSEATSQDNVAIHYTREVSLLEPADAETYPEAEWELNVYYVDADDYKDNNEATASDAVYREINVFKFENDCIVVSSDEIIREPSSFDRTDDSSASNTSDEITYGPNFNRIAEGNYITGSDAVAGGYYRERIAPDIPASGTDTVAANFYKLGTASSSATLTDSVLRTHEAILRQNFQNTIFNTLALTQPVTYRVGYARLFIGQNVMYSFASPMSMVRTFNRSALTIENNIRTFVASSSFRMYNSFKDSVWVDGPSQKLWVTIFDPATSPVAGNSYTYQILLDDIDVTAKVASCKITYGIDKYCGEVDITWADYTMFDLVDCSNITQNFMHERLTVYTSRNGEPAVCQGTFFLEKRGTSATFDKIGLTSWGRTRPAVLSMPYSKPMTKTWDDDTTALAIATEIVATASLPVTLSWEIMDYRVLGGNMIAEAEEPISIISKLAAPVGGILTSDKSGVLRVMYRYVNS